ncbi:hypothetical protein A33M_2729 [Rhodovulum sp. PH10]|nr:hypothetical protein A33M_2729 [Rhodovulum sp. PH10]
MTCAAFAGAHGRLPVRPAYDDAARGNSGRGKEGPDPLGRPLVVPGARVRDAGARGGVPGLRFGSFPGVPFWRSSWRPAGWLRCRPGGVGCETHGGRPRPHPEGRLRPALCSARAQASAAPRRTRAAPCLGLWRRTPAECSSGRGRTLSPVV